MTCLALESGCCFGEKQQVETCGILVGRKLHVTGPFGRTFQAVFRSPELQLFTTPTTFTTASTMLDASTMLTAHPTPAVLFDLRVAEAAVLLAFLCASPLLKGPAPPTAAASNGHSAIVTVVRAVKVPRRQLILSLLNIAAFTAFLDGTVTVANAIFNHVVETKLPPWRGIEYYSVALLVAYAGLSIIGSFKDAHGSSIWQSKLVKLFVLVALGFDIALAILIPLVVPIWKGKFSLRRPSCG